MANPDYATLLAQIAQTPAGPARDALIAQTYQFTEVLTPEEEELFAYCEDDYIEYNPGINNYNSFSQPYMAEGYVELDENGDPFVVIPNSTGFTSYVGVYFDPTTGETT